MQDIKYNSAHDVVAIDKYTDNPNVFKEEMRERAKDREKKEEKDIPEIKWSNHNGNYMKCRKDFVKYMKYCQREYVDPVHDPMYVFAEIVGDTLYLRSASFEKLPSRRDAFFKEYETEIMDCNFSEIRMRSYGLNYWLYWKDGKIYEYWKK